MFLGYDVRCTCVVGCVRVSLLRVTSFSKHAAMASMTHRLEHLASVVLLSASKVAQAVYTADISEGVCVCVCVCAAICCFVIKLPVTDKTSSLHSLLMPLPITP